MTLSHKPHLMFDERHLVLFTNEYKHRRQRLFKRLALPVYEKYLSTWAVKDFCAYQAIDQLIHYWVWNKIWARRYG